MKCQFGLLHTDGRPVTPDDISRMSEVFSSKRTELSGEIVDGPLFMAFRGDRIAPEEDFEIQPLKQGFHVLTWDGRLDNREETLSELGFKTSSDIPDPAIVLKSYEGFSRAAFKKLIGEFALTLWSKRSRTLRFVRSTCGARPLFYTRVGRTLFWSSDFAHLVRISGVDLSVNKLYVLEYLLTQPRTSHSPLANVNSVPANALVVLKHGEVQNIDELWDASAVNALDYRDDRQYEEHLRELLTQAVRVRMRAKTPIFAELSGGLDSSSVVLTADRVLKEKNLPTAHVQTLSFVYEQSQTADERRFIALVEERRGIYGQHVDEEAQGFTLGLGVPQFTGLPNPLHCSPGRYETYARLMKVLHGRVLLTGVGGDHLFWSAPEGTALVADELWRGSLLGLHRECRVWSRAMRVPYGHLFARALPMAFGGPFNPLEVPVWLDREMKTIASDHKRELLGDQRGDVLPSLRSKQFLVDLMFRNVGCGYFNEYTDIYVSHPYTYRPLVEFCLATPLSQFLRAGKTRSLMRRAFADLLPTKICNRVSKPGIDETYIRALQREWAVHSNLREWAICKHGLIDAARLSASLDRTLLGIHQQCGLLIRLTSMERWLRSLDMIPNRTEPSKGSAQDPCQLSNVV